METLAFFLCIVAVMLTICDWLQTMFIASNPFDDYHEHNTILGRDPSPRRVSIYFGIVLVIEILTATALHSFGYIGTLCCSAGALAALEFACVRHNYIDGIRIK